MQTLLDGLTRQIICGLARAIWVGGLARARGRVVIKPRGVALARARMPLCLFGLARSQGPRGRVRRCWVLSGFILVLSGFIRLYPVLSGFIRFYPVLSGFGGFYRALVGFRGLSWVWVGFSASLLVDVGPNNHRTPNKATYHHF